MGIILAAFLHSDPFVLGDSRKLQKRNPTDVLDEIRGQITRKLYRHNCFSRCDGLDCFSSMRGNAIDSLDFCFIVSLYVKKTFYILSWDIFPHLLYDSLVLNQSDCHLGPPTRAAQSQRMKETYRVKQTSIYR